MYHNAHAINVCKHSILHVTDSPIFGQEGLVSKPKPCDLSQHSLICRKALSPLWNSEADPGGGSGEGCNPPPPFGNFSNLSGYPCLSLFHTKNNIVSYNISSSPIDYYKKTVAIPLHSLIIQMKDRFSDEDRHARHLLYLVP